MLGTPDNNAGSNAVNAMRTRHADHHQGPGVPSSDLQAEYTQAIRPCYPTFFETPWAFGGSPYTLFGGNHCSDRLRSRLSGSERGEQKPIDAASGVLYFRITKVRSDCAEAGAVWSMKDRKHWSPRGVIAKR